jgi:hypothetical protein
VTDSTKTTCSNCGAEIPAAQTAPGVPRAPCEQCGATARTIAASIATTIRISGAAKAEVLTYPRALLGAASELVKQNHYAIAVVVAHMAAEVAVDRALSEAFAARKIEDLEDAVGGFLNGYSLGNDRTLALYVALTGDNPKTQPFWSQFKESAARRNRIAHASATASANEAEASIAAVKALLDHMRR